MKISKSTLSILIILALAVVTIVILLTKNNEPAKPALPTTPDVELTATPSAEKESAAQFLEEINFPSKGSVRLEIDPSDVAIGMAEGFQGLNESSSAPFTIFVIYGAVDADVVLVNGNWKVWGNASESFVQNEVDAQVAALKESHSDEFIARGYRVVECREQVESCTTLLSFP